MKNIDELIAKLESYEDYDGFNDDLVVALREQRDEIAETTAALHAGHCNIVAHLDLAERAETAEAERDAAIRDAERYWWVRTLANMDYPVRHGAPGISINMPTGNNACHYPVQSDLDAAIDAAIAKFEKEHGR